MRDKEFMTSNQVLNGIQKTRRRKGEDVRTHKTEISSDDIASMFASPVLSSGTPWGLLYRVFFQVCLHFARRGREGLRALTRDSFKFEVDGRGIKYAEMAFNESEKTKQGTEKDMK